MSLYSADLAATCNALGYYDEKTKKYYADENTLETVKDLIRYLRRDDENYEVRRQLGQSNVLQTDLLPLLKTYWEETELFDVVLRLLVNLSTPPLILWNQEIPTDKNVRNYFMQIEEHLQGYKWSFTDHSLWAVLSARLSKILDTDHNERAEDNSVIIERTLVLMRNVLYVPADLSIERRADDDANIHDQVSFAMHQSGILDLLLYICSTPGEKAYHMHALEILSHLLREQNPSELAKTEMQRNEAEKLKNESELMSIRQRETIKRQQKMKSFSGARHSRFGGTYVVKTMKSISDNDLIYHKPLSKLEALSFDVDKQKPKTPKNRLPFHVGSTERRSAFPIRMFLKEFCVEFLNGAYNTIMYQVKDRLVRAKSHSQDASYYLWALRFFMEFNRAYKFEVKLVSETVSVQIFHYVQQHMENYFDMIQSDKKKIRSWAQRLHFALLAYRELLLTLCAMDRSPDGTVRDSSRVIKSNIFYVLEYRELVLTLLVTYDELKMSDQYLKDLIDTQHIFMKSFETFCRDGAVIVQQKTKSRKKKKAVQSAPEIPEINLERQWDEACQQISLVLEANVNIPNDIVPFDAASEVPIDDQKSEAMINIQRKLRNGEFENAIGLLRAARNVWPENNSFGNNDMSQEEEFIALRDIFMADLGENEPVQVQPIYDANNEEEDEEEDGTQYSESDLKFEDFVKRLAHPKVVKAVSLALAMFEENSSSTNHCIVKLMHRIAFDCKMYVMFFQVSLFLTFKKIYEMKGIAEYKELVRFVTYILRQFFKIAETNKFVFMESLFAKTTRDAYDVEFGYGTYQQRNQASSKAWTEEEEDEVRRLFMEHKEKQLEDDVVDWIQSNLIDNTRTRRGVLLKMKELYLLADYKGPKKARISNKTKQHWTEEEEEQLRELYDHFKDAMDPLGCIMDRLNVPRPKNRIIDKLLVLGLIEDRKEVRKKRVKGASRSGSGNARRAQQESDSPSDSSEDEFSTLNGSAKSSNKRITNGSNKPGVITASPRRLAENVLKLTEAPGMKDALEWLKESFADAIEDFEEDDVEGIPLVPIMDHAVAAMEDADFQGLLRAMGISNPLNEQEIYWRIPAYMSLDIMKSHLELLTKALDGTLTIPEEENIQVDDNQDHVSPEDIELEEPVAGPSRKRRFLSSGSEVDGEALENAEARLEKEYRDKKKKVLKKKKLDKNQDDNRKKKSEKKNRRSSDGDKSTKPIKSKPSEAQNEKYKSKEFIETDDDFSSDDGESARRIEEYQRQQLMANVEENARKKGLVQVDRKVGDDVEKSSESGASDEDVDGSEEEENVDKSSESLEDDGDKDLSRKDAGSSREKNGSEGAATTRNNMSKKVVESSDEENRNNGSAFNRTEKDENEDGRNITGSDASSSDEERTSRVPASKKKNMSTKVLESSSDEEDNSKGAASKKRNTSRKVLESSSDEEDVSKDNALDGRNLSKKLLESSSDEETSSKNEVNKNDLNAASVKVNRSRKVLDSSSDEDTNKENEAANKNFKKILKKAFESDDE